MAFGGRLSGVVWPAFAALTLACGLAACKSKPPEDGRPESARAFPLADRPVSRVVKASFSTEAQRDKHNEANVVMDLAQIGEGMSVADIGAGEGYYTARLAQRVGAKGRVLGEDIDPNIVQQLGLRVERERLENVSIKLGAEDDPKLPDNSFDRILLIHVYHEVTEPYALLWHLRPALRVGGKVIVVDVDRETDKHGIPPELLFCEFAAVGFRLTEFVRKPELQGYYAQFEAGAPRPAPEAIVPCRLSSKTAEN